MFYIRSVRSILFSERIGPIFTNYEEAKSFGDYLWDYKTNGEFMFDDLRLIEEDEFFNKTVNHWFVMRETEDRCFV